MNLYTITHAYQRATTRRPLNNAALLVTLFALAAALETLPL